MIISKERIETFRKEAEICLRFEPKLLAVGVIELIKEIETDGWIKVSEGLPEDETPVLIVLNGEIRIGELCWDYPGYEETYFPYRYWDDPVNSGQDWRWDDVTHWKPLPELPTDLEGNLDPSVEVSPNNELKKPPASSSSSRLNS